MCLTIRSQFAFHLPPEYGIIPASARNIPFHGYPDGRGLPTWTTLTLSTSWLTYDLEDIVVRVHWFVRRFPNELETWPYVLPNHLVRRHHRGVYRVAGIPVFLFIRMFLLHRPGNKDNASPS